jgi:hypothetical protein
MRIHVAIIPFTPLHGLHEGAGAPLLKRGLVYPLPDATGAITCSKPGMDGTVTPVFDFWRGGTGMSSVGALLFDSSMQLSIDNDAM